MSAKSSFLLCCSAAVALLISWHPCRSSAAEQPPARALGIGAEAPDFDLPGVDGRQHRLADFADAKVLLVIFSCNHCPTAQAYEDRMIQLDRDYRDRGVALVVISPNDPQAVRLDELGYSDLGDSLADMKIRARDRSFPFPYLYDGDQQLVSRAYGVQATPHVFIFDAMRRLRYVGRIDDGEVKPPTSHDARNAIEALLAGRPVPVASTRVFGCSTKWKSKRDSARQARQQWEREPVELTPIDAATVAKRLRGKSDKYRLVNVWASWCAPCIDELPQLVDMNRMYRRRPLQIVTISLDDPQDPKVPLKILRECHASTTNYLFAGDDRDALATALDAKWQGPLPYTVLIAPDGSVVYRHADAIDALEVKQQIVRRIGRTYASRR